MPVSTDGGGVGAAHITRLIREAAQGWVAETAAAVEAETKNQLDVLIYRTPERGYRRTGNLRNSVRHKLVSRNVAEVQAHAEYARAVHEGTSRMGPRPYMANALKRDAPRMAERLARQIQRRVK